MAKLKIFAHRGHWCGIDEIQNTLESLGMAIPANHHMEVDVRFEHIHVKQTTSQEEINKFTPFISHDPIVKKENPFPLETMFARFGDEFINRKLTLAFHIKEGWDEQQHIDEMARIIALHEIKHFFFFGFKTEEQKAKWADAFGWNQIADEIETSDKASTSKQVEAACKSECTHVWIAELGGEMLTNKHWKELKDSKKLLTIVSPDCFSGDNDRFVEFLKLAFEDKPLFHGICTDHPALFAQYLKKQ